MHDDVEYVPSKGRQSSLLSEHDRDKQRSVNGPVENKVRLIRSGMGTVNSDQQLEDAPTRSNCVGSVADVDDELPIYGIGHR